MKILHLLLTRAWRPTTLGLAALIAAATAIADLGVGLERKFAEFGADLRPRRASGDFHIVEIDARSITAIDRWPWPRTNHALVVDRLKNAGATSIAFDVDFSSRAATGDDATFAAALARADGNVILPTFGQYAGGGHTQWTDSLPLPELRDHASLGAVSIRPDGDGYVRRAPMGTITDGVPRPSLSAILANASGQVGEEFPIDFAIDPHTIPRHSFIDIRDGRFDPRQIAGKKIIIGATAIEMGDRYAVPNYGVIPGVVIHTLAAETLRRGVPREIGWRAPLMVALGLGWIILRVRRRATLLIAVVGSPVALFIVSVGAQAWLNWVIALAPAFTALASVGAAALIKRLLASANRKRSHDPATGIPNRIAYRIAGDAGAGIVAARFSDFDKLSAALSEQALADLVRRVRDRVALVAEEETIFRVEDRVLAWRCRDRSVLDDRLSALRAMMLNPVEVAGRRIDVTLAIGFAAADNDGGGENTLPNAIMAAERALVSGLAWHCHDSSEAEELQIGLSLLGELDEAIKNDEIQVLYQPKLNLLSETIVSVEALVRWHHRTRGFLKPDFFIPLAERSERIAGLTLYVLARTMEDLSHWRAAGHNVTAAVNISAKLLNCASFLAAVGDLLAVSPVPPSSLIFEVTESAAMKDAQEAAAALQSFRNLGIAISMDDYGTGQSTLSYLKALPLNELKIDRSFVQFAHQKHNDAVLVQSTIQLAHDLGIRVVAEGVEETECLLFLKSLNCDLIQGYVISKPVSAAEIQRLLQAPLKVAA